MMKSQMDPASKRRRRTAEKSFLRQSPPVGKFEYLPLSNDPGTLSIRLLDLEDGDSGDILRCRVYHVDLRDGIQVPEYEAVSYSWDRDSERVAFAVGLSNILRHERREVSLVERASPSRLLVCNGRVLKIQPNLYDFLVRLRAQRRQQQPRKCTLWIDAICINQEGEGEQPRIEKHKQILNMGRIYSSATRVLVWLGESRGLSPKLPDFLAGLPTFDEQSQYERKGFRVEHRFTPGVRSSSPSKIRSDWDIMVRSMGLYDPLWRSLWNLCGKQHIHYFKLSAQLGKLASREYFRRMWVVQELYFAREVLCLFGPIQLTWNDIVKSQRILAAWFTWTGDNENFRRHPGLFSLPHVVGTRRRQLQDDQKDKKHSLQNHSEWSLDDILFLLRDHIATQPEDKVLSIVSMLDKPTVQEIETGAMRHDGRVRFDQLYFNCAAIIAREHGWPYVLTLVALGAAETDDLPSWVPDLRQPLSPRPFWHFGVTQARITKSADSRDNDNRSRSANSMSNDFTVARSPCWTLTVPLATFDTIVQVGECDIELGQDEVDYIQGHIFDLLTRLGQRYSPTGELTLDVLMRILTADVFGRLPEANTAKHTVDHRRLELWMWLPNFRDVGRDVGKTLKYPSMSALHNTPAINGYNIDPKACIKAFVETHDSASYHLSTGPQGSEASKKSLREKLALYHRTYPANEKKFTLNHAVGWTLDYFQRRIYGVGHAIDLVYRGRRIFRTRSGYLGCGPRSIRLGDVVCFLAGAQTPFLFRRMDRLQPPRSYIPNHSDVTKAPVPSAADLGQVRVVGEAYVHGVMHKEFVEGLVNDFARVSVV